jgi:hypothetical protein
MKKLKPWPTPELPPAPVSVETHGPVSCWTPEQWTAWRKWASSLNHYPGEPPAQNRSEKHADTDNRQD